MKTPEEWYEIWGPKLLSEKNFLDLIRYVQHDALHDAAKFMDSRAEFYGEQLEGMGGDDFASLEFASGACHYAANVLRARAPNYRQDRIHP